MRWPGGLAGSPAWPPSGIELTLTEFWDGSTWAIKPSANPAGEEISSLSGVSCTSVTSGMAVGFWSTGNGVYFTLAEAWNGMSWARRSTPALRAAGSFAGASCSTAARCTGVGVIANSAGTPMPLAERYE